MAWQVKFRQALENAFDSATMELLVADYFGKSFANIVDPAAGPLAFRLLKLTREAEMDGWLLDLVAAASERRPRNVEIRQIAETLGLTSTGPRLINPTGQTLEALVKKNAQFINPAKFAEVIPQIESQVCFIDIPGGGGTGFLVGPDLVLTNDHVIAPIREGRARWQDVRCRFDYRRAADGTLLNRKKETAVALVSQDWLLFRSPPSASDYNRQVSSVVPGELDCALIRLADAVGEAPVGPDTVDAKASPRHWISASDPAPAIAAGNQVFMFSHAAGDPLQLSIGTVTEFNAEGTRLRYDANSMAGSSGSPVFNADLQLVALHHATDKTSPEKWNQGIPFSCIQSLWKSKLTPGGVPI